MALTLADICQRYRERLRIVHGKSITAEQCSALNAVVGCHTPQYGTLALSCQDCAGTQCRHRSCGHRFCNQCQQHSTAQWLARQSSKLLPVEYYLVTFTLPYELRGLAKANDSVVLPLLMQCAAGTLQRFGMNKAGLNAKLGLTAVLHIHTRRLDYHPHVHILVPGGGVNPDRRQWRTLKGPYLFNGLALGKVFRGSFLAALSQTGLSIPATPAKWVAHCERVGKGLQALQYLSRYLYRGVISNSNILHDDGTHVTFQYQDSKTRTTRYRTLPGEDFIHLLLQHVLPKGLHRSRDYGFLHGNARRLLGIVQWVLRVALPEPKQPSRASFLCPHCNGRMRVTHMMPAMTPLLAGTG